MARPANLNKVKTTTVSCKFEDTLLKRIDSFCEMRNITRTDLLKEACEMRLSMLTCPDCETLNVSNARQCSVCGYEFAGIDGLRQRYAIEYYSLVGLVANVESELAFCYVLFEKIGAVEKEGYAALKDEVSRLNDAYTKRFEIEWIQNRELPVVRKNSIRGLVSYLEIPVKFTGFVDEDEEGNLVAMSVEEQEEILNRFFDELEEGILRVKADLEVVRFIHRQLEEFAEGKRERFEAVEKEEE